MATARPLSDAIDALQTNWRDWLRPIWDDVGAPIEEALAREAAAAATVYPSRELVFRAFDITPIEDTRVVLLGQDPYIRPGQAMGLAFSVPATVPAPPSLRNVFKELDRVYRVTRLCPDLTDWAQQGVLLLNTALTVRAGESGSHAAVWTAFTERILRDIAECTETVVFMLWGAHAQSYLPVIEPFVKSNRHLVLTWTHPSPLSRRPFTGCGHFDAANTFLEAQEREPVEWIPGLKPPARPRMVESYTHDAPISWDA